MADLKDIQIDEKSNNIHVERVVPKTNKHGVVLVPQPSDDPNDPLNWSAIKKVTVLVIISLGAYCAVLSSQVNAAGFEQQSALYDKTITEVSYSLTASGLSIVFGPFLWSMLTSVMPTQALIFYSNILGAVCNIWSAQMIQPDQYAGFVTSRFFAGLLGPSATVVGSSIITDVFFLHDRGKCFAAFTTSLLYGSASASTFSGFITQNHSWRLQFWYVVGLQCLLAILCLVFLEDTNYVRREGQVEPLREGFATRLRKTYFGLREDTASLPSRGIGERVKILYQATICPTLLVVGFAILISFTWAVGVGATLSIFLQTPIDKGGYGFTPFQNACYTFTVRVAIFLAQLYGSFLNDRLPLEICKRRGGLWFPEYRPYPMILPLAVLGPVGLGLFGASLHYHFPYTTLAGASFLLNFADVAMIPPMQTYVVEAIGPKLATEVITILNLYRVVLGGLGPLFIFKWIDAAGVKWTFGTMSFMLVTAFFIMCGVMGRGHKLRNMNSFRNEDEGDLKIISSNKEEMT